MRFPGEPPRTVVGLHFVWAVDCPECDGCGFAFEDEWEVYCPCEAGGWRAMHDGADCTGYALLASVAAANLATAFRPDAIPPA